MIAFVSRHRLMTVLVVAAVVLAGILAANRAQAARNSTNFAAMFGETVGLYPGSDVRMLGVPVGKVTKVVPRGTQVKVSMQLRDGYKAAATTRAVIVAPTLVSDRYVQLTEPYESGEPLKEDTVIPLSETATPVEIDQLTASVDEMTRRLGPDGVNSSGALSDLLTVAAKNLDGNGEYINETIRNVGNLMGTLADSSEDLFATIANFKEFTDMLVANDRQVGDVNKRFAAVSQYLAEDRDDMAKASANLGDALAVVSGFIKDNRGSMKSSVEKLIGPTQVLVKQRESLEEMVRTVPLVLQNFINAYDEQRNVISGRGNLNELFLWAVK